MEVKIPNAMIPFCLMPFGLPGTVERGARRKGRRVAYVFVFILANDIHAYRKLRS